MTIPTPLEYQTFWRRFWSGCIDGVVLSPISWAHVSSVAARRAIHDLIAGSVVVRVEAAVPGQSS